MWASFQRIIELFTQKLSLSYQKYGFGIRDPGSGSRSQKGTGSWIWIRNTGCGSALVSMRIPIRIWIQHFLSMRIRIQGFDDQKLKKKIRTEKKST
jgi:hypothetical protein